MNEAIRCIRRFLARQSNNVLQSQGAKSENGHLLFDCRERRRNSNGHAVVAVPTAALLPWGSWARRKSSPQCAGYVDPGSAAHQYMLRRARDTRWLSRGYAKGARKAFAIERPDLGVDDARRAPAIERLEHLLGCNAPHVLARLLRDTGRVRARQHIIKLQQRMFRRRRFAGPDVEAGARNALPAQRLKEGGFVVNEAARRGDEISVRPHQRKLVPTDHAAAFGGQRAIDRDVVGTAQELVKLDLLGAALGNLCDGKIGIVGKHPHAEQSPAKLRNAAADMADPDNADRSPLRLGPHQGVAVDIAVAPERAVALDNALRQRKQHAEHVFGHRMRVTAGLIDDQDTRPRAGLDIDGVEARAVAGDEEKVRCPPQQIVVDMKMRREFVARSTYLIDMCGRKDWRKGVLRAFVFQSIKPHVGT